MIRLIYILFATSGLSALVYEAVWSRYLKLLLGHAVYGQIATLCIFMGGLAAGSFLAARYAKRLRYPFMVYAGIELLIGASGLCYHPLYVYATEHYYVLATNLSPMSAVLAKATLSIALTAPAAALIGATFPVMAIGLMRAMGDQGKRSLSLAYFCNSLGAAAGIVLASYMLIPSYGTQGALGVAAAVNFLLCLAFLVIARRVKIQGAEEQVRFAAATTNNLAPMAAPGSIGSTKLLWYGLACATGAAAFILEIGWTRMLSLLLGSTVHSFDVIVSTFVLGIAIGSLIAKRLIARSRDSSELLANLLILTAIGGAVGMYLYEPAFAWVGRAREFLPMTDTGFLAFSAFKYFVSQC